MARPRSLIERFSFRGRIPGGLGLVLVLTVVTSLAVAFGARHALELFELSSLSAAQADPVDVITGAMFTSPSRDFTLPGAFDLSLTRTYRTTNAARNFGIGHGWSHAFQWTAERKGGFWLVTSPEGRTSEVLRRPEGVAAVLPYGARLYERQGVLLVELDDPFVRILRRSPEGIYRLTSLVDASGNVAKVGWTGHEVTRLRDTVGRRAVLVRTAPGQMEWRGVAVGADGRTEARTLAKYELDDCNDLVRATDSRGRTTHYTYDRGHYLTSARRADGVTFHYRYGTAHGEKRCVETWGELDDVGESFVLTSRTRRAGIFRTSFEYGPGPYDSRVVDGAGGVHLYEGSSLGLVKRYLDPRGVEQTYEYDANGVLESVTDGLGRRTTTTHDADGRLVARSDPAGTTNVAYAAGSGLPTEVTAPDGAQWKRVHDDKGRLVKRVDPGGAATTFAHGARGERIAVKWPDGGIDRMRHDDRGNLVFHQAPSGATEELAYDAFGVLQATKDSSGQVTTFTHDEWGNVLSRRGPQGETAYTLDAMKRVASIRFPSGASCQYRYVLDAIAEVVLTDGPAVERWTHMFDVVLRLRSITNPAGETYSRQYDAVGQVTPRSRFATAVAPWARARAPSNGTRSGGSRGA